MLTAFVVLVVDNCQVKLKLCGLIADRLFILKTISANGRSFIAVNVNRYGGLGAMIALRQTLAIAQFLMTT